MKKIYLIVLIVAVVVFAGIAGAFLILKNAKKSDQNINLSQSENQTLSTELKFDKEGVTADPFSDKNGPFYHNVYKTTSSDGLTFASTGELIAEKASVPDAVKTPDGTLWVYAVDGAQRSKSGVMIMRSKDNGKIWEFGSLQMKTDRKNPGMADPQAVLQEDGSVKLFYLVFPDKKPPLDSTGKPIPTGEKQQIKSATTKDGINFTEEEGARYETTDILTDPDVVKIGGKWFMYLSDGSKNIALSSVDGKTFTKEKIIREQGSVSKTVSAGGGMYRQYFCKDGISSATTTDGLNFTNDPGVRLQSKQGEIICDPSPVKINDQWVLFYKVGQAQVLPKK